jgi:hypothetical protein
MSVADYCQDYISGKIRVNEDYQRKVGLWTSQARSYFIESILLEFPIPKVYLYARLDLKSRQVIKEVVDGQQRTQALVLFYNGKQRLTSNIDTEELRGLRYSQLNDEWQSKFLSYSLPIDQFSGTSDDEVREAFRRMNANNVPLNDEEQRNALFQGEFKWFIVRIGDKYQQHLHKLGLFSRRDLIRMSDLKLYAEIALALDGGFSTVKGKQIDDIYRKYNAAFPIEGEFDRRVSSAVEYVLSRPDLHQSTFLRGHVFQSLALAGLANVDENVRVKLIRAPDQPLADHIRDRAVPIDILAGALQDPESYSGLQEFIDACSKKTNVEESKRLRFLYFYFGLQMQE